MPRPVSDIPNLGPASEAAFARAGITSAEEIEAMTAFYGSDTGRSIMRKMPQAIQLSMEEMQPIMRTMIADMRKTLETELQNADGGAHNNDAAH
mgnify:CR=1 FL=1